MPKFLARILGVEVVFFVLAAAVLPAFEAGFWKGIVPVLSLLPVVLVAAFWQRVRFADVALKTYCIVAALLGIIFVALQLIFTSSVSASPSNLILILETFSVTILYFTLQSNAARRWYSTSSGDTSY